MKEQRTKYATQERWCHENNTEEWGDKRNFGYKLKKGELMNCAN